METTMRGFKAVWFWTFVYCLLTCQAIPTNITYEEISRNFSVDSIDIDSSAEIWNDLLGRSSSSDPIVFHKVHELIRKHQGCESCDAPGAHCDPNAKFSNTVFLSAPPPVKDFLLNPPENEVTDYSVLEDSCSSILYLMNNKEYCGYNLNLIQDEGWRLHGEPQMPNPLAVTSKEVAGKKKPTSAEVWGFGFLFVTLISICSLLGVSLMPFMAKDFYKHVLTVMVGLAVGSLTGSAVFHLLPQAYGLSDTDTNHSYLSISLVTCGGIWMFFMVERILKFIMDYKDRTDAAWNREKIATTPNNSISYASGNSIVRDTNMERALTSNSAPDPGIIYESQEQAIKASFGHQARPRVPSSHDHKLTFKQGKDSVIATVAWMIIFGDGLHNFIDGLSIGAGFNESILTGVSISVAVLCEELPHELGDFAVLLNAGMSIRQALTYNFLSACTCYIGMAVGILLGELEAAVYIFAIAGGMFLYIALVDMVPEMNEIAEESSKMSVRQGIKVLGLQNLGLFIGIFALFILAKYQDNIQF